MRKTSVLGALLAVALAGVTGLQAIPGAPATQPSTQPSTGPATTQSQPSTRPTGPTRFAATITAFEEGDKANPPPQGAVLFVGSSSIVKWNVAKWFPDLKTINRGFGGSTFTDQLHYFERVVPPYKPRLVVFYCGDNDIASGRSAETVLKDFRTFVSKLHAALPDTPMIYIGVKPSASRWKKIEEIRKANRLIQEEIAKDKLLTFLDVDKAMLGEDGMPRKELFVSDNLHLNDEGYKLWTSLLAPLLKSPTTQPK